MLVSYIRGMKKSSTTLLMNARVLHYTYDRGALRFKSIYVYLCWWLHIKGFSPLLNGNHLRWSGILKEVIEFCIFLWGIVHNLWIFHNVSSIFFEFRGSLIFYCKIILGFHSVARVLTGLHKGIVHQNFNPLAR